MDGTGVDYVDSAVRLQYNMIKKVGRGLYGIVWQARRVSDKSETVAIKRMFNAFSNKIDAKRAYREIMYSLHFSKHPNIVRVHDVLAGFSHVDMYLVTNYMESDLGSTIHSMEVF
jgi:serine/threonine protein kinase